MLWPDELLQKVRCLESPNAIVCNHLFQAKVFRVARDYGSPTGKVIKINHADMASKMLNNNVVSCCGAVMQ